MSLSSAPINLASSLPSAILLPLPEILPVSDPRSFRRAAAYRAFFRRVPLAALSLFNSSFHAPSASPPAFSKEEGASLYEDSLLTAILLFFVPPDTAPYSSAASRVPSSIRASPDRSPASLQRLKRRCLPSSDAGMEEPPSGYSSIGRSPIRCPVSAAALTFLVFPVRRFSSTRPSRLIFCTVRAFALNSFPAIQNPPFRDYRIRSHICGIYPIFP